MEIGAWNFFNLQDIHVQKNKLSDSVAKNKRTLAFEIELLEKVDVSLPPLDDGATIKVLFAIDFRAKVAVQLDKPINLELCGL